MPRIAVEDNSRLSLRIQPEEKAKLLRAVALKHTDLTDFVVRHALRGAEAVIEEADHIQPSERDSLRVLDLLEHPPAPNKRLMADLDDVHNETDWTQSVMHVRAPKDHINIRIDHDVLEWFKKSGRGYQTS